MSQHNLGVVFADIAGTTQLFRKIGNSEGQRALERCVKRMERAVEAHHGDLLMPAVDEMIAAFPSADDAVIAAIEMQERIADLPPTSGVKLSIRVGVHFGVDDSGVDELHGITMDAGRALLNIAGPHQIVLCAATAAALSPSLRPLLRSLEDLSIVVDRVDSQLYEVEWAQQPDINPLTLPGLDRTVTLPPLPLAPPAPAAPVRPPAERICLRINGKAYLIDERTPLLTIGRDQGCDIVISDRKASRQHLRIERRGRNRFFLVDASTNGTYVSIGKEKELKLHNAELQIGSRGRIAFGHSSTSPEAEIADFEAL